MSPTERPERTRTPAQEAAWAKVEEERRMAGPPARVGPGAAAVARVVVGVLVMAGALMVWLAVPADDPDTRRDLLLLVGVLGGGAALVVSALPRI